MAVNFLYVFSCLISCVLSASNPEVFYQNAQNIHKPTPSMRYEHTVEMDAHGHYWLFWTANDTYITFEVQVKTNGYIGFGISPNGKMYPSDVMVGWVDAHGQAHIYDYHTEGHSTPILDTSQDWILHEGRENHIGTMLKFSRKLNTCDKDDRAITDDTMRVIYSYQDTDPTDAHSLVYHGTNRGAKSVIFLSNPLDEDDVQLPDDLQQFDFFQTNYHVPSKTTTYACKAFQLPKLTRKHHVVMFEPIVQPGNEMHVHHILIYQCNFSTDTSHLVGRAYDCHHNPPHPLRHCARSVFIAWAIGGGAFYYPPNAGMSIGTDQDPYFFVMQTHYDNPTARSDIVDSSGIRIHYTQNLRYYDVGLLETGLIVSDRQIVPPYEKDFLSQGYCSSKILSKGLPPGGVTVFGVLQHSHLLGRAIKTRHIRNGTELEPLAEDENYDFDYQEIRQLKENRIILPGDSIEVDCFYDSMHKQTVTFGGLTTRDEMCLSFLLYYPRMIMDVCHSSPTYNSLLPPNQQNHLHGYVTSMNWTDPGEHARFYDGLHNSPHFLSGFGYRMVPQAQNIVEPEPSPTVKYVRPQPTCPVV